MKTLFTRTAGAAAAALFIAASAHAAGMLTAKNGMTLYTFDKDTGGASSCYADCAKMWPPYLGKANAKMTAGWTMVKRTGGKMQWAYDGKPVYMFLQGRQEEGRHGRRRHGRRLAHHRRVIELPFPVPQWHSLGGTIGA
jgi:predicted lipoprotein with Yx(FWY)xxD motif